MCASFAPFKDRRYELLLTKSLEFRFKITETSRSLPPDNRMQIFSYMHHASVKWKGLALYPPGPTYAEGSE